MTHNLMRLNRTGKGVPGYWECQWCLLQGYIEFFLQNVCEEPGNESEAIIEAINRSRD